MSAGKGSPVGQPRRVDDLFCRVPPVSLIFSLVVEPLPPPLFGVGQSFQEALS